MAKFKVGDKVRRVSPDGDHIWWDAPQDNLFHGNIYTVTKCTEWDIKLSECKHECLPQLFELVESAQQPVLQPELYTQHELTYIEQLEDEIAKLNDLCNDYAKIIEDKDAKILTLRDEIDELSGWK